MSYQNHEIFVFNIFKHVSSLENIRYFHLQIFIFRDISEQ